MIAPTVITREIIGVLPPFEFMRFQLGFHETRPETISVYEQLTAAELRQRGAAYRPRVVGCHPTHNLATVFHLLRSSARPFAD